MEKADILHLGRLARIKINDDEVVGLQRDINAVLAYVSVVNEIATEGDAKKPGTVFNVFRADTVTTTPGAYRETLLGAAPATERDMVVVKKILDND
jgi:aspartyl/glutamyl-tRNA(Asn/Gln) amidotransferase C subunit